MEELKQSMKKVDLVQNSGTFNYKLVISTEVERKIRFTCQKIWDTEWSGILFFIPEGSFENNDLVIKCIDIYIMDIGTKTYTEFDMNPDVVSYMCDYPELLDCQIGLIHSHNNMDSFFSGTDKQTLKKEGMDRNNFVSLIVNNIGTYTAAITRKIESKQIKESITYKFFDDGEKHDTREYTYNVNEIEYFYLKIEKEKGEKDFYENINNRIEDIKQKKSKTKNINNSLHMNYYKYTGENKNQNDNTYYQKTLFDDIKEETIGDAIPYKEVAVNKKIVDSLVKQLLTCSIIIPNESKVDIEKWAINIPPIYEKRFGIGDVGMKNFIDWADTYIEYITWHIKDEELNNAGFSQADVQSIYSYNLIEVLSALPMNKYIKCYINKLENYIML